MSEELEDWQVAWDIIEDSMRKVQADIQEKGDDSLALLVYRNGLVQGYSDALAVISGCFDPNKNNRYRRIRERLQSERKTVNNT